MASLLDMFGGGGGQYSQAMGPIPGGGLFGNGGLGGGLGGGQPVGPNVGLATAGMGMLGGQSFPQAGMAGLAAQRQQQQRRRKRPGEPGYDPLVDGPPEQAAQADLTRPGGQPWWMPQGGGGLSIGGNRYG